MLVMITLCVLWKNSLDILLIKGKLVQVSGQFPVLGTKSVTGNITNPEIKIQKNKSQTGHVSF